MRKDVFVREFGKFLSENLSDMEIEQIIYQSNEQGEFASETHWYYGWLKFGYYAGYIK